MAQQEEMSLFKFQKRFATEEACQEYLFNTRWPDGFCCPRCGGKKHYLISNEPADEESPQKELAEDMIAIVTGFSARIYSKRSGRLAKRLTELIEQEVTAGENNG